MQCGNAMNLDQNTPSTKKYKEVPKRTRKCQKVPRNCQKIPKKKGTKKYQNVWKCTKKDQKSAKKYQIYVKVREEVPKTTKSTKKFKNV